MVRWYDFISAFVFANVIWITFWVPAIGPIAAYLVYEVWMDVYCRYRKFNEEKFF